MFIFSNNVKLFTLKVNQIYTLIFVTTLSNLLSCLCIQWKTKLNIVQSFLFWFIFFCSQFIVVRASSITWNLDFDFDFTVHSLYSCGLGLLHEIWIWILILPYTVYICVVKSITWFFFYFFFELYIIYTHAGQEYHATYPCAIRRVIWLLSCILTLQKFSIDRTNPQSFFVNQFVCAIGVSLLNHIWTIPFWEKLVVHSMCGYDCSRDSQHQIPYLKGTRSYLFIESLWKLKI